MPFQGSSPDLRGDAPWKLRFRAWSVASTSIAPYEGGKAEDVTPELEPYALAGLAFSRDASTLGFTTATRNGLELFVVGMDGSGRLARPRRTTRSDQRTGRSRPLPELAQRCRRSPAAGASRARGRRDAGRLVA